MSSITLSEAAMRSDGELRVLSNGCRVSAGDQVADPDRSRGAVAAGAVVDCVPAGSKVSLESGLPRSRAAGSAVMPGWPERAAAPPSATARDSAVPALAADVRRFRHRAGRRSGLGGRHRADRAQVAFNHRQPIDHMPERVVERPRANPGYDGRFPTGRSASRTVRA